MTYELEYFDKLIMASEADQEYEQVADEICQEELRIIKAFQTKIFSLQDEKLMEMYIHHNQAAIIRMMDELTNTYYLGIQAVDKRTSNDEVVIRIFGILDRLLKNIERSNYFDETHKIPESYRRGACLEFQERLDRLYKNAAPFSKSELFKIAIFPIKKFTNGIKKKISYKRLDYLRELLKAIEQVHDEAGGSELKEESDLIKYMFYLNYNSSHFVEYITERVLSSLNEIEAINDRIDKLLLYKKQVNQAQLKPGFQLKLKRTSIKILLLDWLTEELHYYENKKLLWSKPTSELTDLLPDNFKIKTDLSVPQLACFLEALIGNKVIKNTNVTETLRFYSAFTQTKNTSNMSPESLRIKYYNIEDSTREVIRDVLTKMLGHVNKPLLN